MLTDSGLFYYAYSGNIAMANLVRDVLTYHLDHGMTPSTWNWPGVAYASADAGSLTYAGALYGNAAGRGDGVGVIEPDKVGEIGLAFLKYYEFSGRLASGTPRCKRLMSWRVTSEPAAPHSRRGPSASTLRPTSFESSTARMSFHRFDCSTN